MLRPVSWACSATQLMRGDDLGDVGRAVGGADLETHDAARPARRP